MDSFQFVLALDLGKSLEDLSAMSRREYLAWQAFYTYRKAMQDFEGSKGG